MGDYSCPECGWETDDLPEAVTHEVDRWERLDDWKKNFRYDDDPDQMKNRYVEHTKGHSDMSTHECPECGYEGWFQGWVS